MTGQPLSRIEGQAPETAPERPLSQQPEAGDAMADVPVLGPATAELASEQHASGRATRSEESDATLEHGTQSQGIAGEMISYSTSL